MFRPVIFCYSDGRAQRNVGKAQRSLDNQGTLSITGNGTMKELSRQDAWLPYRSEIKSATVGEGITNIGRLAFIWTATA